MKSNNNRSNKRITKPGPATVATQPAPAPAATQLSKPTPAPTAAPVSKPAPRPQMPTPTRTVAIAPETVQVGFALFHPNANRVSLCSEFNGWSPEATPMKRDSGGRWQTTLSLKPGRYQYKFVVDGEWVSDPEARESVPNQYGTLNSLVVVQA